MFVKKRVHQYPRYDIVIYACEHCGHKERGRYDDYDLIGLPARLCGNCGKTSAESLKPNIGEQPNDTIN